MIIKIVETTDVHGHLSTASFIEKGKEENFGLSKVKTYLDRLRETYENVIYIDNGDLLQGSPLTSYYRKNDTSEKMADAYNLLDPDAIVLGNHDFNFGLTYLNKFIGKVQAPVLSANTILDQGLNIKAYEIIEIAGVKIGILGLITQYIPHWEDPAHIAGIEFKSAISQAHYYVPMLKNELACDIIIVSYHGGFERDLISGDEVEIQTGENEGYELLKSNLAIDILLTGHQHREIADIIDGIAVLQPGYAGSKIGEVTIEIDDDKNVHLLESKLVDLSDIEKSPIVEDLLASDMKAVDKMLDQKCGKIQPDALISSVIDAQISGHPYINLINQIQMDYTDTDIAAAALFKTDTSGFPADVSMRDIMANYIFDNTLTSVEVTGLEFKQILEFNSNYFTVDQDANLIINPTYNYPKNNIFNYDIYSGIEYTYDVSMPIGQRLVSLTYHGREIADDETIRFATNSYRAKGGGNFPVLDGSQIISESSISMPDLIYQYIDDHGVVDIKGYPTINIIGYKNIYRD